MQSGLPLARIGCQALKSAAELQLVIYTDGGAKTVEVRAKRSVAGTSRLVHTLAHTPASAHTHARVATTPVLNASIAGMRDRITRFSRKYNMTARYKLNIAYSTNITGVIYCV